MRKDALNETIFSEARGKDSCIFSLIASKVQINSVKEAGAYQELLLVRV